MEISKSVRKRAGQVIPDDIYISPSFEEGNKNVPEAEMEHVAPLGAKENVVEFTQRAQVQKNPDIDRVKVRVSEVLENIGNYTAQVSDLVAKIDAERENIRKIISEL